MKQPGPKFFSGAGFATDQDSALDIGGTLYMPCDAVHSGIAAEDPAIGIFRGQLQQSVN
jgi:hypothetical protein